MTSDPHPRHVAAPAEAILDEVERAVVGKRDVLELVLLALLADGHVLLEDVPGVAKTLIARSFAAATGLRFGRVQFTPDLLPSDVTGSSVFDQRAASFEFRPGAGVLQPAAGRRDQPRPAQDAGRAAGGHGGAPGHRRRRHPPARAALPRARHAEPDRVRGHLPAARGPARPLPHAPARRLPRRPTTNGACSTPARAAAPTPSRSPRSSTARGCCACRPPSRPSTSAPRSGATWSPSPRPRARARRSRSAPARAARWRCCAWPARGPRWRGATSSCPTTSRPSPCPALAHRLVLRPELWVRRVDAGRRRARGCSTTCPRPRRPSRRTMSAQRVTDAR